MERQKHGFIFENYIKDKYGVILNSNYTAEWDGIYKGFPVSIKYIKKGNSIDLGSLFRQSNITTDFYLFVNFYENPKDIKDSNTYILFIKHEQWLKYFMPLDKFYDIFKDALDSVSNDIKDDTKWSILRLKCINFWKENTNNIITVNGKRDHKKQKRWQCSISYTKFFNELVPKYQIME